MCLQFACCMLRARWGAGAIKTIWHTTLNVSRRGRQAEQEVGGETCATGVGNVLGRV